jgi:alpha-tubulin suppressor-like RCC1 family protein
MTPFGGSKINIIEVGDAAAYALTVDNKLFSWGYGTDGARGDNDASTAIKSTPTPVYQSGVLNGVTISQISAGGNVTMVLGTNGKLYSWYILINYSNI